MESATDHICVVNKLVCHHISRIRPQRIVSGYLIVWRSELRVYMCHSAQAPLSAGVHTVALVCCPPLY